MGRILDLPELGHAAIATTHVRIGFGESEQLGVLPNQHYVVKSKLPHRLTPELLKLPSPDL